MSLDSILDDIKDNVANIEIANEGFINKKAISTTNKVNVIDLKYEQLPSELKDKFYKFYNLLSIKSNIDNLNKVEKSIAIEVFTMLPDLDKTEEAKLTSSPSVINKEVLTNILNTRIDYSVLNELTEKIKPIKLELEENREKIEFVREYLANFRDTVSSDYSRLLENPPIIVIDKTNINLLTVNLRDIAYNRISVNYDKYDEDNILSKKYFSLLSDSTLTEYYKLTSDLNDNNVSLQLIYTKLMDNLYSIEYKLTEINNFITYTDDLKIGDKINNNLLDIVEKSDSIIEYLVWFKAMYIILNTQDSFVEKLKDIFAFLD